MSDRIVVMGQACIAQIGAPEEIYDRPTNKYVAQFIGRTNALGLARIGPRRWRLNELSLDFDEPELAAPWPDDAETLCLRPERLRRADTRMSPIEFGALVTEVTFLGDSIHYQLLASGGAELQMHESRGAHTAPARRGDEVRLTFDPATASALA